MIQQEFRILVILSIISFLVDVISGKTTHYTKCFKNPKFFSVLFLHHMVSVFSYIGWLSSNVYILIYYIISNIMIFVHWNCYYDKCVISDYVRKECGSSNIPFRDLYFFLGLKNYMKHICGFFMIISIVKIYRIISF